jgi:hypothetical protein
MRANKIKQSFKNCAGLAMDCGTELVLLGPFLEFFYIYFFMIFEK